MCPDNDVQVLDAFRTCLGLPYFAHHQIEHNHNNDDGDCRGENAAKKNSMNLNSAERA
jgi:hypothetical protein